MTEILQSIILGSFTGAAAAACIVSYTSTKHRERLRALGAELQAAENLCADLILMVPKAKLEELAEVLE